MKTEFVLMCENCLTLEIMSTRMCCFVDRVVIALLRKNTVFGFCREDIVIICSFGFASCSNVGLLFKIGSSV